MIPISTELLFFRPFWAPKSKSPGISAQFTVPGIRNMFPEPGLWVAKSDIPLMKNLIFHS